MTDPSTRPINVEGTLDAFPASWQVDEISWPFGQQRRIVGWSDELLAEVELPDSRNRSGPTTTGPQEITAPKRKPAVINAPDFGRRGLAALSHWEGVVEDIEGDTFRCRLVPLTSVPPDAADFELTEFSVEDLANDDDRDLVKPGAVFYWTIGRARNQAGTVTNVSLVRFRRLPVPTRSQHERAEREAEELLRLFGVENGSESSDG
jgi:hypothetical protein